jgi:hypothetical protein
VIQHPVKFPKSDHSKHADQQPKQDLVTGEHDQQSDRPKRDRADKPQNENRTGRNHVGAGLLKSYGHAFASFPRNESCASADKRVRKDGTSCFQRVGKGNAFGPLVLNPFTERSLGTTVLDWTCYCGAGDGVGEAASVAGDGVCAVASTVEDGAAGAGNTGPLNIFDLFCFCVCDPSSVRCL